MQVEINTDNMSNRCEIHHKPLRYQVKLIPVNEPRYETQRAMMCINCYHKHITHRPNSPHFCKFCLNNSTNNLQASNP